MLDTGIIKLINAPKLVILGCAAADTVLAVPAVLADPAVVADPAVMADPALVANVALGTVPETLAPGIDVNPAPEPLN